jgi:hypothetical protein
VETQFGSASGRPAAHAAIGTAARGHAADAACTAAGGLIIVAGAIVSLAYPGTGQHHIGPAAAGAALVFGLIMVGLGMALRAVPHHYTQLTAATALGLTVLGLVTFAVTGVRLFGAITLAHVTSGLATLLLVPWLEPTAVATLTKYQSGIGTMVAVAGCLVAAVGAYAACHRRL